MESILIQLDALGAWYTACVIFTILLLVGFVVSFIIAGIHMSHKRTRRSEGLSSFFTTIAAAFLVVALVPATAVCLLNVEQQVWNQKLIAEKIEQIEQDGAHLSVQAKEILKERLSEQIISGDIELCQVEES